MNAENKTILIKNIAKINFATFIILIIVDYLYLKKKFFKCRIKTIIIFLHQTTIKNQF